MKYIFVLIYHGLRLGLIILSGLVLLTETSFSQQDIKLEPWYCLGPIKDVEFGNTEKSFKTVFHPEVDVLKAGNKLVNLQKQYIVPIFPGYPDSVRGWVKPADWIDGYRNKLPYGPPPARNETFYLYRTIRAQKATEVELHFMGEDKFAIWLNGEPIVTDGTSIIRRGDLHEISRFSVSLHAGDNRLLIKSTSLFGPHFYSFAIPGCTDYSSFDLTAAIKAKEIWCPPLNDISISEVDINKAIELMESEKENFSFEVKSTPMYDPPVIKMDEALNMNYKNSEDGENYVNRLKTVQSNVGQDGLVPESAINQLWDKTKESLAPIVFIKTPSYNVNAIAPNTATGATPASICMLNPAKPNEPLKTIFHEEGTAIYDLSLSYDAQTIFFSAKRPGVKGGWHIYEIGIDGKNLKQITSGNSDEINPELLPNGDIVFVSTRANSYVLCQTKRAQLLYVAKRDGSNIRLLSANLDSDHTPKVMSDGRILFTRWDYGVERGVFARHALWTINPDGTGLKLFFGNTIEDPAGFWNAVPIPNRPEVVCVFGGHHNSHSGMVGLVWNKLGMESPRGEGFRWLTKEMLSYGDLGWREGYRNPYPLNEHLFLVSVTASPKQPHGVYLLDDRGNKHLLYEDEELSCFFPVPIKPRTKPPVIIGNADELEYTYKHPYELIREPDEKYGTFYMQNVYEMQDLGYPEVRKLVPGEVKSLQIIEQTFKSDSTNAPRWGGKPLVGRGTMHVKRLIGNVPVEEDGSAHFVAPALRNISFNALDKDGRMVMRMSSDIHIMPGEVRGCVGCHEDRLSTPPMTGNILAMKRAPSIPERPDWGTNGIIDFVKVVQPVFDKYCVECHSGETPEAAIDLSGDKTRYFNMAYENLMERDLVNYECLQSTDYGETTPKTRGSYVSKIVDYINTPEHSGHTISEEEKQRIYTWIDANVPYYGTYEYVLGPVTPGDRDRWYYQTESEHDKGWFKDKLVPVYEKRCADCHAREYVVTFFQSSEKRVILHSDMWTGRALMSHNFPMGQPATRLVGPEYRINLSNPEYSQLLTAPLAKEAGGLGLCREKNGKSVFVDKTDPDYKALLKAIQTGNKVMKGNPRVDMEDTNKRIWNVE